MLSNTPLTCFSRDSDSALNQHSAAALMLQPPPRLGLGGRLHLNRLSTRKSLFRSPRSTDLTLMMRTSLVETHTSTDTRSKAGCSLRDSALGQAIKIIYSLFSDISSNVLGLWLLRVSMITFAKVFASLLACPVISALSETPRPRRSTGNELEGIVLNFGVVVVAILIPLFHGLLGEERDLLERVSRRRVDFGLV